MTRAHDSDILRRARQICPHLNTMLCIVIMFGLRGRIAGLSFATA
jgi:hypothetical protein